MSTTPAQPIQRGPIAREPRVQPLTQPQLDAAATHITTAANALSDRQSQLNRESAEVTRQRAKAAEDLKRRRVAAIQAAAKQQIALNRQRETQPQIGDMVVVDLEKARPEQHTTGIRNAIKHLFNAGAHLTTGRVSDISHETMGRVLTVQAPHATLQVPELLATRADLHEAVDADEDWNSPGEPR